MIYLTEEVKAFIGRYLGTRFTFKEGRFKGEVVTVVGYVDDCLGDPVVIVEIPETSLERGWGLSELDPEDHVIADVAEDVQLRYAHIENLKEC